MKLFWDANVLLDLVDQDRPDHADAVALLKWVESRSATNLCAWHSLSILDYLCRRKFGAADSSEIVREILRVFVVPPTGSREALNAFTWLAGDFEDALQITSAVLGRADFIVTNDRKGFSKCPIEVVQPAAFLSKQGA